MQHRMKLHDNPFKKIKCGTKTIEMRLYDEKRSKISVNDTIVFMNAESKESIECLVIGLYRYPSFFELYERHNKTSIGYNVNDIADANDMYKIYSRSDIEKYGVIGIEIKVI